MPTHATEDCQGGPRYTKHTEIIGIQKEVTFRYAQNITKERTTQEELRTAKLVFHEENSTLQDAMKTKGMGEMTVVQRLLDVAYPNMEAFKKKRCC